MKNLEELKTRRKVLDDYLESVDTDLDLPEINEAKEDLSRVVSQIRELRVKEAAEAAGLAFWGEIAKHFPEVKTGDLDPGSVRKFSEACEEVVTDWYDCNDPFGEYDEEN
jgi:hypothetical protein